MKWEWLLNGQINEPEAGSVKGREASKVEDLVKLNSQTYCQFLEFVQE